MFSIAAEQNGRDIDTSLLLLTMAALLGVLIAAAVLFWLIGRMSYAKRKMAVHTLVEDLGLSPVVDENGKRESSWPRHSFSMLQPPIVGDGHEDERRWDLCSFSLLSPASATRKELHHRCVGRLGEFNAELFDVHRRMNTRANMEDRPEQLPPGELHADKPDSVVDSKETAILLTREDMDLPPLMLTPDSRAKRFLDGRRDEKPQDDFEDKNTLKALDPPRARSLFVGELREHLAENRDLTIEANGPQVLVYRESQVLSPEQISRLLDESIWIAERLHEANSAHRR